MSHFLNEQGAGTKEHLKVSKLTKCQGFGSNTKMFWNVLIY